MIRSSYEIRWVDVGGGMKYPLGYRIWLMRLERILSSQWDEALAGISSGAHILDHRSAVYEPRFRSVFYGHFEWPLGKWARAYCTRCGPEYGSLSHGLFCERHPYNPMGIYAYSDPEPVAWYLAIQLDNISSGFHPAHSMIAEGWSLVAGVCLGGGRLVPHERGWRSEMAMIVRLFGPDMQHLYVWGADPSDRMACCVIEWRYGFDLPILPSSGFPDRVRRMLELKRMSENYWGCIRR